MGPYATKHNLSLLSHFPFTKVTNSSTPTKPPTHKIKILKRKLIYRKIKMIPK